MRALVRLAPLLMAATVAGCGSGGGTDGVATAGGTTAAPSLAPEDASLRFAQCMREHGHDVPDPGQDGLVVIAPGSGAHARDLAEPPEECRQYAPGAGGTGRRLSPEDQDRMLAFARCMREHGVDVPDPRADGGVTVELPDGVRPGDPAVRSAQEACRAFFGPPGLEPGGAP